MNDTRPPELVLASTSRSRRAMLEAARVPFVPANPGVDEETAKHALRARGHDARQLADALAELKAIKLSSRMPTGLVLGCDQTLALDDGTMIDKAVDRDDAERILRLLSGRSHYLYCAAVIAERGEAVWRHIERVKLTMRPLSDAFIARYLDGDWDECRWCVGCYRIEGPGAQLFTGVEGTQFAIQGLPLLPLLDYLRTRGILAS